MSDVKKRFRVYQRGNAPTWVYSTHGGPVMDHGFFNSFDSEDDAIRYATPYDAEVRDGDEADKVIWMPGKLIGKVLA